MNTEMTYEEFMQLRDRNELPEQYLVKLSVEELRAAFLAEEERQKDEAFDERMGYLNNYGPSHVPASFITFDGDGEVI